MTDLNDNIERLIVRKLDGELTEQEQLELDRALIRHPQARQLMDEHARIDELAADALADVLGDSRPAFDVNALPTRGAALPVGRYHRGWWLVPGAVAAALLAVVIARFPLTSPVADVVANRESSIPMRIDSVERYGGGAGANDLMRDASIQSTGNRIKRDVGREIIGVVGDDGNLYWIEVDRVRTIRRPDTGTLNRSWPGEI